MGRYLSAREAAAELGIKVQTLYAYVSRGLIRSETGVGSTRARRYRREDIERLKQQQQSLRDPQQAAANALHWGTPILESRITLIGDGHLYYRGYDVTNLAVHRSVEEVASLIWLNGFDMTEHLFPARPAKLPARYLAALPQHRDVGVLQRFHVVLSLASADDSAAYDLRAAGVAALGARILRMLALTAAGESSSSQDIVETLCRGWGLHGSAPRRLLRAALILCADHELNISSFTARCVASAGATPYAVVTAGLSALEGIRHGGVTEKVEAFLQGIPTPSAIRPALRGRLQQGEDLPGFGHPLYSDGDPRGRALLDMAAAEFPDSPAVAMSRATVSGVYELVGLHPTIDFGLVTVCRTLGLRSGSPLAVFALGRVIGWIGHAIEQYETGQLIRPRARYSGNMPPLE